MLIETGWGRSSRVILPDEYAVVRLVLASTLVERQGATGRLPDLDAAIELEERALLDLAPDSAAWASTASSLANQHLVRSGFTVGAADHDDAVEWSRSAVHTSGADGSNRSRHLASSGSACWPAIRLRRSKICRKWNFLLAGSSGTGGFRSLSTGRRFPALLAPQSPRRAGISEVEW